MLKLKFCSSFVNIINHQQKTVGDGDRGGSAKIANSHWIMEALEINTDMITMGISSQYALSTTNSYLPSICNIWCWKKIKKSVNSTQRAITWSSNINDKS